MCIRDSLKTLEGSMRFLIGALTDILGRPDVRHAADALTPHLLPLALSLIHI